MCTSAICVEEINTKRGYKLALFMSGMLVLSACGGADLEAGDGHKTAASGGSATINISGTEHQFSDVECFSGFNDDLMVVLQNDEIYLEVSQLQPEQNTWTVSYLSGSFGGEGNLHSKMEKAETYFTRKYDVTRNGNLIKGTAMAERGTLPRNPVDIAIDITCQKLK